MPGIAGFIRKKGREANAVEVNRRLLDKMCQRLNHTDGYATETAVHPWFALAYVGLSRPNEKRLVDRSEGCAAYSGYIYDWKDNSADVRRTAPDMPSQLVHGFRKLGHDLPDRIDGSFNLAVFDTTAEKALIATDRMGHRHLYYADLGELFLFATELQAFLACPEFTRGLDKHTIEDFFNVGYPFGDRTIFEKAKFLRGGHRIEYQQGETRLSKWWDFNFDIESTASVPELIERAEAAYAGVIQKRTAGYEHVLLPLSGGLDSRLIAGQAVKAGIRPIFVTHGIPGCLDLSIAQKMAATLNFEHRFIEIQPGWVLDYMDDFARYAEGMVDLSPAILLGIGAQYNLPQQSTCLLNGIFGGPTNFGNAYFREEDIDLVLTPEKRIENVTRSVRAHHDMQAFYALFRPEWRNRFPQAFIKNVTEEMDFHSKVTDKFHFQRDIFFIRNRLTRYMNRVDCNRYRWHDHFALYDDKLVDFYQQLPSLLKTKRRFMIAYIKALFPHLAAVEYQATGVNLYSTPKSDPLGLKPRYRRAMHLLERLTLGRYKYYDKRNYAHHAQWYRVDRRLRDRYESILTDKRTQERGYFEPSAVKALLKRQREGGEAFYELDWLFSFEYFHRKFIDSDAPWV